MKICPKCYAEYDDIDFDCIECYGEGYDIKLVDTGDFFRHMEEGDLRARRDALKRSLVPERTKKIILRRIDKILDQIRANKGG